MADRLPRFDFGDETDPRFADRLAVACRAAAAGDLEALRVELGDDESPGLVWSSRSRVLAAALAAGPPGEPAARRIAQMGRYDPDCISRAAMRARSPEAVEALFRHDVGVVNMPGLLASPNGGFLARSDDQDWIVAENAIPGLAVAGGVAREPIAVDPDPDGKACVEFAVTHSPPYGADHIELAHAWKGPDWTIEWIKARARTHRFDIECWDIFGIACARWSLPYALALATHAPTEPWDEDLCDRRDDVLCDGCGAVPACDTCIQCAECWADIVAHGEEDHVCGTEYRFRRGVFVDFLRAIDPDAPPAVDQFAVLCGCGDLYNLLPHVPGALELAREIDDRRHARGCVSQLLAGAPEKVAAEAGATPLEIEAARRGPGALTKPARRA